MIAAAWKVGNFLGTAAGLQVSVAVVKANDRVGITDVDILRIRAWRIEGNAIRLLESTHEGLGLLRLAISANAAKDFDIAGMALGDENVSVRGSSHPSRLIQASGEELDLESRRRDGKGVRRTVDDSGPIDRRLSGKWSRQVLGRDVVRSSGLLIAIVGKGCLGLRSVVTLALC